MDDTVSYHNVPIELDLMRNVILLRHQDGGRRSHRLTVVAVTPSCRLALLSLVSILFRKENILIDN